MRRWQLVVIPIAVFFVVLISGILVMNFIIDKSSDNPSGNNPSTSSSDVSGEPSEKSSDKTEDFDPKTEYSNYLSELKPEFADKNIKANVIVGAKDFTVNSLANDDGTSLIEFTNNKNGFSIYTMKDEVYMYASNTIDGEVINSWAKSEKGENYKPLTKLDDYFSIENLENQLKNAESAEYQETVEENGTTYDVLLFKAVKNDNILETFNLELTEEDVAEHHISASDGSDEDSEDNEDGEEEPAGEPDAQSAENGEYTEYSVYVNRKTKNIEKVVFSTDTYKATVDIIDATTINLPNGAEIAEEITTEDLEFLLLGVKMAIVGEET